MSNGGFALRLCSIICHLRASLLSAVSTRAHAVTQPSVIENTPHRTLFFCPRPSITAPSASVTSIVLHLLPRLLPASRKQLTFTSLTPNQQQERNRKCNDQHSHSQVVTPVGFQSAVSVLHKTATEGR